MKTLAAPFAAAVLLVSLTACGDDAGPSTAADPASSTTETPDAPDAVPAAVGQVRSRTLPTVMDTGDGPELCLGAVAESFPPQCSGPAIAGWGWQAQAPNFDKQGEVRWGTFAVTGTWDGTTFTVSDAIPGALYDPAPTVPAELPNPSRDLDQAALEAIGAEVQDDLPGVLTAFPDQEGHLLVDVTYDDGSLQDYVDATYGDGVVVVSGALVDA